MDKSRVSKETGVGTTASLSHDDNLNEEIDTKDNEGEEEGDEGEEGDDEEEEEKINKRQGEGKRPPKIPQEKGTVAITENGESGTHRKENK